jgi:electron transfer flavoprotein beta subunit
MHVCQASLRNGGCIHVTQRIEVGTVRMEAQTPVLLSFTKEVNKPRFISFLGILEAEKKETLVWSNEDLGLDASQVGLSGSPTQMADMLVRERRRRGERIQGDPKDVARQIVDRLYQLGIL